MTDSRATLQRSTRDRVDPPSSSTAGLDSVVCFVVDGKSYALDVAVVREVVSIEKVLPVPRAAPAILGVFALHGATVALVDTRVVFGVPATTAATSALVVARGHRTICAMTVDRVLGVSPFAEASFVPAVRGREPPQIAGFMSDERGALVTVLDTATIVHALEALRF